MAFTFDVQPGEDDRFPRPRQLLYGEDEFKDNEVGITHPDTSAFVRLKDNGDVEIVAGEGLMIVLHPTKRSITFVADSIKFLTRDQGGLRWNQSFFNERAANFNEPTLIPADDQSASSIYKGVEYFLHDEQPEADPTDVVRRKHFPEVQVTDPETGDQISYGRYYVKYGRPPAFGKKPAPPAGATGPPYEVPPGMEFTQDMVLDSKTGESISRQEYYRRYGPG